MYAEYTHTLYIESLIYARLVMLPQFKAEESSSEKVIFPRSEYTNSIWIISNLKKFLVEGSKVHQTVSSQGEMEMK